MTNTEKIEALRKKADDDIRNTQQRFASRVEQAEKAKNVWAFLTIVSLIVLTVVILAPIVPFYLEGFIHMPGLISSWRVVNGVGTFLLGCLFGFSLWKAWDTDKRYRALYRQRERIIEDINRRTEQDIYNLS